MTILEKLTKILLQLLEIINRFFNSLTIVNEVYIFGHSLSEIDFDYFAEIKKNVSLTCRWYISYHDNIVNAQNLIRRLNIKNFQLFKF